MPAIIEIIKSITKIIASHFAIVIEVPEMNPNPNTAATMAMIRNTIAQPNNPDSPFLSILVYYVKEIKLYIVELYDDILLIVTKPCGFCLWFCDYRGNLLHLTPI